MRTSQSGYSEMSCFCQMGKLSDINFEMYILLKFSKDIQVVFCNFTKVYIYLNFSLRISFGFIQPAAAAAAKSLQSCPTLCNPTDGSPPGSSVLEWGAIAFSVIQPNSVVFYTFLGFKNCNKFSMETTFVCYLVINNFFLVILFSYNYLTKTIVNCFFFFLKSR